MRASACLRETKMNWSQGAEPAYDHFGGLCWSSNPVRARLGWLGWCTLRRAAGRMELGFSHSLACWFWRTRDGKDNHLDCPPRICLDIAAHCAFCPLYYAAFSAQEGRRSLLSRVKAGLISGRRRSSLQGSFYWFACLF